MDNKKFTLKYHLERANYFIKSGVWIIEGEIIEVLLPYLTRDFCFVSSGFYLNVFAVHLFQRLFLLFSFTSENLCGGKFHNRLRDVFAPQVVRYVDLMESSIAQSIHKGFEKETWKPQG